MSVFFTSIAAMVHSWIILFLLVLGCQHIVNAESQVILDASKATVKYSSRVGVLLTYLKKRKYADFVSAFAETVTLASGEGGTGNDDTITEIRKVSERLDVIMKEVEGMKDHIVDKVLSEINYSENYNLKWRSIKEIIYTINNDFNTLSLMVSNRTKYYRGHIDTYLNLTIARHNIENQLYNLHQAFSSKDPLGGDSLIDILLSNSQDLYYMCHYEQSLNMVIYIMYDTIMATEIKGLTILNSMYMLKDAEDYKKELEMIEFKFHKRYQRTTEAVKRALKLASRKVWICDETIPHSKSYIELEKFLKQYIVSDCEIHPQGLCERNEINLERTYMGGGRIARCPPSDNWKSLTQRYGFYCEGSLIDCRKVEFGSYCIDQSLGIGEERISYMEKLYQTPYGSDTACASRNISGRVAHYIDKKECNQNLCTCDRTDLWKSDRYVNLKDVTADEKYVVTGLRFVRENHVLYIQIKQGILQEFGKVDPNPDTHRWKEINKVDIRNREDYFKLELKAETPDKWFQSKYITKAAINLDDVDSATSSDMHEAYYSNETIGYAVTGVKFITNRVQNSGVHLNLAVQVKPFYVHSGTFLKTTEELHGGWISQVTNYYDGPNVTKDEITNIRWTLDDLKNREFSSSRPSMPKREVINVLILEKPMHKTTSASPMSRPGTFVKFGYSSLMKDFGEATLPFIDIYPVETNPPMALSGAGIFHKSDPGTGGFLALKLLTFDYGTYLSSTQP